MELSSRVRVLFDRVLVFVSLTLYSVGGCCTEGGSQLTYKSTTMFYLALQCDSVR